DDLQCALAAAAAGDEIWVARSLTNYRPGANRAATFPLVSGVGGFGGFVGNETALGQRPPLNFELNAQATLDGDLFAHDFANLDQGDNAFHVLSGTLLSAGTVLDGVRVQEGAADDAFPNDGGGGLAATGSQMSLADDLFIRNLSVNSGGGVFANIEQLT